MSMTQWKEGTPYPDALVPKTGSVKGGKIEHRIEEKPLLHVCCNRDHFAEVNVDSDPTCNPDVVADVLEGLPFEDDSFAATFADFPWVKDWMKNTSSALIEMLRVAPVAYIICPWLVGASYAHPESIFVSWRPGINHPILFVKYVRQDAAYDKRVGR